MDELVCLDDLGNTSTSFRTLLGTRERRQVKVAQATDKKRYLAPTIQLDPSAQMTPSGSCLSLCSS